MLNKLTAEAGLKLLTHFQDAETEITTAGLEAKRSATRNKLRYVLESLFYCIVLYCLAIAVLVLLTVYCGCETSLQRPRTQGPCSPYSFLGTKVVW